MSRSPLADPVYRPTNTTPPGTPTAASPPGDSHQTRGTVEGDRPQSTHRVRIPSPPIPTRSFSPNVLDPVVQQELYTLDSLSVTNLYESLAPLPPFPNCPGAQAKDSSLLLKRPPPASIFINSNKDLVKIYSAVRGHGVPNYRGAKIALDSGLNMEAWETHAHKITDKSLIPLLKYGFPAGYDTLVQPVTGLKNHSSALANPTQVTDYINTELSFDALIGPFQQEPFNQWFRTNPLLTRPKQDSDKLRVILDLSFPHEGSVNAGIPCNELDAADFKLSLPTPHILADRIRQLGRGCHLYKIDLSQAYRQLRSRPLDWPLLGIAWGQNFYIDRAIPFGLRHGASACQRTTEAVAEIAAHDVGAAPHPYVDDTSGAALPGEATSHYEYILKVMAELGLIPALNKCSPPSTQLMWIGVFFDTLAMSMEISAVKVAEAARLCAEFLGKVAVSHIYMERLMGKIFHAIKSCKGARRFTARLLQLMNAAAASHDLTTQITHEARLDAAWLSAFLPAFNGVTLIKDTLADFSVEVDSCLTGAGGVCSEVGYFTISYPSAITDCHFPIAALECFNLLLSLRLWKGSWAGKHVLVFSDNWAVVCALQSGRAHEPLFQGCLREIWWLACLQDIELTIRHKPGAQLVEADALSRIASQPDTNSRFHHIVNSIGLPKFSVQPVLLCPPIPI